MFFSNFHMIKISFVWLINYVVGCSSAPLQAVIFRCQASKESNAYSSAAGLLSHVRILNDQGEHI